jgi:predicted DNA-binding protein (MmcQ/YjbR family)
MLCTARLISPTLPRMNVDVEWVRQLCLGFPHASEEVTWGADLTFRISGKIFAVTVLETAPVWLSFKSTEENFAQLTERPGIIPAPYMARNMWVALETRDALGREELGVLLRQSYDLVFVKLPRKIQEGLPQVKQPRRKRKASPRVRRKKS